MKLLLLLSIALILTTGEKRSYGSTGGTDNIYPSRSRLAKNRFKPKKSPHVEQTGTSIPKSINIYKVSENTSTAYCNEKHNSNGVASSIFQDIELASDKCKWRKNMNHSLIREVKKISLQYQRMKIEWGRNVAPKYLQVVCGENGNNSSYANRVSHYLKSLWESGIRNIVLFGDSVMEQQFHVLSITLEVLRFKSLIQLKYVSASGRDIIKTKEQINQAFSDTTKKSIVIANFGLHYQHEFSSTGKTAILNAVNALLGAWQAIELERRPMLIWREGTPLQYPSRNGWWSPSFRECKLNCCNCVAISSSMRKGYATEHLNDTQWDLFPSEFVETSAVPLIQEHNVKICHVYNALAARPDLHAGRKYPDCTHFGVDALLYLNEISLLCIEKEKNIL